MVRFCRGMLVAIVLAALWVPATHATERSREEIITEALGHQPFADRAGGVSWYVSNSEFMLLQPLTSTERASDTPGGLAAGWTVAVDAVAGVEAVQEEYRLLFHDGAAVGGEHLTYSAVGAVASRRRVDEAGEETLSERVTYRGDGTVRSVRRCDSEGCLTARFSPPGAGGSELLIGSSLAMEIRFNVTARPEYIRVERDGMLTEEYLTYGDTGLSERRVVRGDTVVVTTYADGLVQTEEERTGQRVVRRVENTYDTQDRVVRQVETRRNLRRETQWSYRNGDEYVMERFENEALLLREELTGDTTIQTHFRHGEPVFRETLIDGEVIRSEIFAGGRFHEEAPR